MTKTEPSSSSHKDKNAHSATPTKAKAARKRTLVPVVTCPSAFPISTKSQLSSSKAAAATTTTAAVASKDKNNNSNTRHAAGDRHQSATKQPNKWLDFHQTAHEIRHFGSTGFDGRQKKDYAQEQYQRLTGRPQRHHQVPLPIVRGIRKKAAEREARRLHEAKEAGIVLPSASSRSSKNNNATKRQGDRQKKSQRDAASRVHGPAPSIGFVSKGVLKLKGKPA